MRFQTLLQWLSWQENLHFTEIDPGLERIGQVWQRMGETKTFPIITVAGTNGKGSSVALLSAILIEAGFQIGSYTSPHLLRYNERISIDDTPVDDAQICAAFAKIDDARQDISLTYFEFATLAAMSIFCQQRIDIAILEVGMGGRLDAVNLFDADIALITPIGLDHTAWLGDNREQIGREKAGIIRSGHPVICSEVTPPESVLGHALSLNAPLYIAGRDFNKSCYLKDWEWQGAYQSYSHLPFPALAGHYQLQNAAAVLQVIALLINFGLNIPEPAIRRGLQAVKLYGRFQIIEGPVKLIVDVTHNQQGAINLARLLIENLCKGKTIAILAMLKDKDAGAMVEILDPVIDLWMVAGLAGSRGMPVDTMVAQVANSNISSPLQSYQTVAQAYQQAVKQAKPGDRILVFGSFHTVEAVMSLLPKFVDPADASSVNGS